MNISGKHPAVIVALALWAGATRSSGNEPPVVSITWPNSQSVFRTGTLLRLKANAVDKDGSIKEVRFFANSNLIGVVTNSPFNLVWQLPPPCDQDFRLKAVAVDDSGATAESLPVQVYGVCGRPFFTVLEIASPADRQLFAAPATVPFVVEFLAGLSVANVEFFVGTNSVGLVEAHMNTAEPNPSIVLTNLPRGEYRLTVRDHLNSSCTCRNKTNVIEVVELGVQRAVVTSDGRFQFEVLTSFPGVRTVVQASPNLRDWIPVSTNYPAGDSFIFTESAPTPEARRFYRVVLPDQ